MVDGDTRAGKVASKGAPLETGSKVKTLKPPQKKASGGKRLSLKDFPAVGRETADLRLKNEPIGSYLWRR
jgi:hypothetical protein